MTRACIATVTALAALLLVAPRAHATPLDLGQVPADAGAVIHVDVDALRQTSLYAPLTAVLAAQQIDAPIRTMVDAVLDTSAGLTIWLQDAKGGHGQDDNDEALLLDFPAGSPQPARLVQTFALMTHATQAHGRYTSKDGKVVFAVDGSRIVLADRAAILDKALAVLHGKAPAMTAKMLPGGAPPRGVFLLVALGTSVLDQVKQSANSALLKTDITSLAVNVGEVGGELRARAVALMSTADGAQKIKSVVDGLVALASLSNQIKLPRPITDYVATKVSGATVELDVKVPTAELKKLLQDSQADAKTK